ncbi:MAG TPA: DUF4173 domain-containing protein [Xanthobacteraceae bacterium]|nr:DUF4173 domain-containing protein [Xanthobacteraceae bacterium]
MTDLSAPCPSYTSAVTVEGRKILIVLAVAAFADWLFFRHPVGISIAVFLAAIAGATSVANPFRASPKESAIAVGILLAGLAPLALRTSLLACLVGVAATAYAALVIADPDRGGGWRARIAKSLWLLVDGSWQGFADVAAITRRPMQGPSGSVLSTTLAGWIVPVALGGVFVLLFAEANPLIDNWLARIDLRNWFSAVDPPRVFFWLVTGLLVWPFLFLRGYSTLRKHLFDQFEPEFLPDHRVSVAPSILAIDRSMVVRSLVIFNLLFAVQTGLDIVYLWGGAALPHGMSYATYAHRGAYPLILTALLAAAFVLATMRPGSDTERSHLVRGLVYLWTGQNVVLVISSILRLDLYVEVYSLTCLRVAAFIWMGLVATGLMLIAARIALQRSNMWLVRSNLASLGIVLYVCSFVNFPSVIAGYNVTHSREMSGQGVKLDEAYLSSLGPQAIPAFDRWFDVSPVITAQALGWRNSAAREHVQNQQNWRAWTYRNATLARYLRERPVLGAVNYTGRTP